MEVYKDIDSIKGCLRKLKKEGKSIGIVPTMGYLHEGHKSLIKKASLENDVTVVTIYVNPIQFGAGEDFEKYPRDSERDIKVSSEAGAQIVFLPDTAEMYPAGYRTYVDVTDITEVLCGASRPGHFKGVTTIVAKLFNIVQPDRAYFGQKDAQQAVIVRQMVRDLNMDVGIVVCPIIREKDGLAMSSRNVYLDNEERSQALVLSEALKMAEELTNRGERDALLLKSKMIALIKRKPLAVIDYVEAVDLETLKSVRTLNGKVLVALAVKFGNTRLIDNTLLEISN